MTDEQKRIFVHAHMGMILKCIDERVHLEAKRKGIEACNGTTPPVQTFRRPVMAKPCMIGEMHTASAELAHFLATLLVDPTSITTAKAESTIRSFTDAWRRSTGNALEPTGT